MNQVSNKASLNFLVHGAVVYMKGREMDSMKTAKL